ncbi:hypothetical protein D8S78_10180 [Natrialba swarupiae]|nr:hypothetical protein [Natrialba swarupiae]
MRPSGDGYRMRHVEISLRAETREPILATLDAKSVDYTVVPPPTRGVRRRRLVYAAGECRRDRTGRPAGGGLGEDDHTVVVTAETVISKPFGALKSEYTGDVLSDERLARHELYANSTASSRRCRCT